MIPIRYFDVASAVFQTGASFMLLLNVLHLYKAKHVRGVSPWCQLWMCLWGTMMPFYFYQLEQWYSMWAAILILVVNSTWCGQIIFYNHKEGRLKGETTMRK